jgi:hypothetical protein
MRMNVDDFARPISDAARIVRSGLPSSNTIELCDLVQAGWLHAVRYLQGAESASRTLIFVSVKHAMHQAALDWGQHAWATTSGKRSARGHARRRRIGDPPKLTGLHEWHRCVPTPDLALMIDIKRTLLSMPLREAVSWYSQRQLDEPSHKLAPEFGVTHTRVVQLAAAANDKLRQVIDPDREMRPSNTIILSDWKAKYRHERNQRYGELRRLGASVKTAQRGAKSVRLYADAMRVLHTELKPLRKCGP